MNLQPFIDRVGIPIEIVGNPSKFVRGIISRMGRSADDMTVSYRRRAKFGPDSNINGGLLVRDILNDDYYLVLSVHKQMHEGQLIGFYAQLGKCNAIIAVKSVLSTVNDDGIPIEGESNKAIDVRAHQTFISSRMRQEDPGLLSTTICTFHVQNSVPIALLDRIVLNNGQKYQVDAIDDISLPGLLVVQVSTDMRG